MKVLLTACICAAMTILVVGWFAPPPLAHYYLGAGLATMLFGPFCAVIGFTIGRQA